jgi:hypothetical protein
MPTAVRSQPCPSLQFTMSALSVGVASGSQRGRDGLWKVSLGPLPAYTIHTDPLGKEGS